MLTVPGFTRVHRFSSYLSKDRPGMMSTGAVDRFRLDPPNMKISINIHF